MDRILAMAQHTAIGVRTSKRDGSGYVADNADNPLLCKYHLADRWRANRQGSGIHVR